MESFEFYDADSTYFWKIERDDIVSECGCVVTTRITEANNEINDVPTGPHEWGWGWLEGLNKVCQQKELKYNGAKYFESALKKGVHNMCGPPSALVIYYRSQDLEFGTWYNENTALKLFWNNRQGECKHPSNLLTLHQIWEETNWLK